MDIPLSAILLNTVNFFFQFLSLLVIVRVFMSWLAPRAQNGLAQFIYGTTEPILGLFRLLPLRIGMMDFTPIAALFAIDYLLRPAALYIVQTILKLLAGA